MLVYVNRSVFTWWSIPVTRDPRGWRGRGAHLVLRHFRDGLDIQDRWIALDELVSEPLVCQERLQQHGIGGREVAARPAELPALLLVERSDLHWSLRGAPAYRGGGAAGAAAAGGGGGAGRAVLLGA